MYFRLLISSRRLLDLRTYFFRKIGCNQFLPLRGEQENIERPPNPGSSWKVISKIIMQCRASKTTQLAMKLTAVIMLAFCLQVSARGFGQISLNEKNASLQKVFKEIQKQSGFDFLYSADLLQKAGRVSLQLNNVSLEEAVKASIHGKALTFSIVHNTVVIKPGVAITQSNAVEKAVAFISVDGNVSDEEGKPVEGATVTVKSSNVAVATDAKGGFHLDNISDGEILIISSIGFEKVEVKAARQIKVVLKRRLVGVDEVIITTGLYKRPTENFTGVATTVTGDQLRNVNSMNVLDAIKVFDPAVRIPDNIQFGNDPNRLPNISMRGTNNFPVQGEEVALPASGADFMASYQSNPSMPLFILDGFEVSLQKIYDLDINRIQSMTILKDAVATSAYGSRAANGVIVVETRQPQPGKLTVNYSGTLQITGPDLTSYQLLNASDKLKLEKLSGVYNGDGHADYQLYYDQLYAMRRADVERGVNTYWLAQPLQTGVGNKHSLFVEGGDQYLRYGASFGYSNNKGVMKGSQRDNIEGGMILSYRKKQILVRNQMNLSSNQSQNSPYGAFSDYSRLNQYWSPYDADGKVRKVLEVFSIPGYLGSTLITNPMYDATLGTVDRSKYFGITNNTYLEWRLNNGIRLTGKLGLEKQEDQSDKFLPADHTSFANITDFNSDEYFTRGSYDKSNGGFSSIDASIIGDYNKTIGKNLFFVTAGASLAQQNSQGSTVSVRGFPNNKLDEFFFGREYLKDSRPLGQNNITRRMSVFTSINYTYDKRFLVDFSWNVDGSTQFGADNRFAPFWAVGLGWNLHEESFLAHLRDSWLSRLRIRGSVGTTGSQQFSPYMAVSTYEYNTNQDYLGMFGAYLMSYGNAALKWQQTLKQNAGADISILKDRIVLSVDAYRETTNNLLLDINTPPSVGVSSYKENVGELENIGMEARLNAFIIKNERKSTFWSVFVNAIHNQNKIMKISNSLKKLNEKNDLITEDLQTRPQLRFEEGQSVNAIWAVRSAGIDPSTGKELFYKRNGELTNQWNAADKVIVGDALPKISGNLGTNFSFKGIQLGAYFSYQMGGMLYNQTLADRIENADINYNVDERVLLGRWLNPGDVTFFKGLRDIDGYQVLSLTNATSRFVQKNNFLNLESISLGYLVPDRFVSKWGFKNTRLNFQVNNLAMFSTINVERGLAYPFARNFTLNLNTSF